MGLWVEQGLSEQLGLPGKQVHKERLARLGQLGRLVLLVLLVPLVPLEKREARVQLAVREWRV